MAWYTNGSFVSNIVCFNDGTIDYITPNEMTNDETGRLKL